MKPDEARVLAALNRNFSEADHAILKLTAYNSLKRCVASSAGTRFFTIAEQTLYNDMIAGAIRIFDDHKEAGSLWYIIRCFRNVAQNIAMTCGIDMDALRKIVPKLRHIRDKTHFHIDRRTVAEPDLVWTNAGLGYDELTNALHDAATLLTKIKQEVYGGEMNRLTPYDGSDVKQIVEAYIASKKV